MEQQDYKHIIQDITNIYLGGRNSYKELMDSDQVPFKLKTVFAGVMEKEVDENTTLENHFFFMDKSSLSYMTYKRMKVRLLLNVFYEDGHGRNKPGYRIDEFTMDELIDSRVLQANRNCTFLTEIRIRKINIIGV